MATTNTLKIPVGASNLQFAKITKDTRDALTIEAPILVAQDYLQKISVQPESDANKIYGGDKLLAILGSKSPGKGSIELASLPEELEVALQGAKKDPTTGIITYTSNDISGEWALSFQINYNDKSYALIGLGKVTFSLVDEQGETKEEKAKALSYKLEFEAMDRINDDFYKKKVYSDASGFSEDKFYSELFKVSTI